MAGGAPLEIAPSIPLEALVDTSLDVSLGDVSLEGEGFGGAA